MQPMQTVDSEYKPWGGLAGIYKGEEAANKSFANDMSLGEQSLALEKAANENPLALIMKQRDAAHATQDMSAPMMGARQDLAVGTAQSAKAKGSMDMNALPEKMKLQSLELMGKTSKQEVDNTIAGIEKFITDATSNGPMGMAQAVAGLPPQFQQMVSKLSASGQDPVEAAQKLRETLIAMRSFNEDHVRKQAEIKAQGVEQREGINLRGQWDEKIQGIKEAGDLKIAQLRESGANARAELQANRGEMSTVKAFLLEGIKGENRLIAQTSKQEVEALEKQLEQKINPNRPLTDKQEEKNAEIRKKIQGVEKAASERMQEVNKRARDLMAATTPEAVAKVTSYLEEGASTGGAIPPPPVKGKVTQIGGSSQAAPAQQARVEAPTTATVEVQPSYEKDGFTPTKDYAAYLLKKKTEEENLRLKKEKEVRERMKKNVEERNQYAPRWANIPQI